MKDQKPFWRQAASVITAFIVVMSFVIVGYIDLFAQIVFDKTVTVDKGWLAAMLSLASAGFGYLVGKSTEKKQSPINRPLCDSCPLRDYVKE